MRRTLWAAAVLCAAAASAACGKKGNPLPPFARIPAAVDKITATRLGSDVYVTLTIPATNIDTSLPVSISRVNVYGYTGRTAPTLRRWAELGTVVARIPVAPLPLVPETGAPPPAPDLSAGALPGTSVTILDTLTSDELVQGRVPVIDPRRPELVPLPEAGATSGAALRRFYLAIPFSARGEPGPPGAQTEFPLVAPPEAPTAVRATYSPSGVSVRWEPAGGLLGFLLDAPLAPEPLPFDQPDVAGPVVPPLVEAGVPPGPTRYNVYRELAPDPLGLLVTGAAPSWSATAPFTVNVTPLAAMSLSDDIEFGRERCYTVRALRGTAPASAMSDPSARTCVTPIDIFPPSAPAGLATVPSEGGISLIWEPNTELDLGGYRVLRREVGDATLRQLTDTPIAEARFRDTTVKAGTRYIYSVVAVDAQVPLPNVSAESERVEETAR